VLVQLLLLELSTAIPGAIIGLVRANAGLKVAKSISELTKSMDNFVAIFIRVIPYYIGFRRIKNLFQIWALKER
jgi:hypothetical protein